MSKKYSMNIDIIVQRGYRQPLDIIDTFKTTLEYIISI